MPFMNSVKGFQHVGTDKVRSGLVEAGVNEKFVAELNDKAAEELLEGIRLLLKKREEKLD